MKIFHTPSCHLFLNLFLASSLVTRGVAGGFRGEVNQNQTLPLLNGKPFNCTNQVETVVVIGKNNVDIEINCKNKPTEKLDRTVCRQFNKAGEPKYFLPVWMVCPESCSIGQKICNPGCVNDVERLIVIDNKSQDRDVECERKPGKNSRYCLQFNKLTSRRVYSDCPLMCPGFSPCFSN